MTIELYHNDKSTCSQKVRLCLAELGIRWTDRHVDLMAQENLQPAYLAINPNGVVPALVHDGAVIIESTVICEYLCEAFEDPDHLLPATAPARAEMRVWLRYIDEVPSMAVRVPTYQIIKSRFDDMNDADYEDFTRRNPLRRDFFERLGRDGFSKRDTESADKQLRQTVDRMEVVLAARSWLCGSGYSVADICAVPVFQRLADIGRASLWDDRPAVAAWYARLGARPAYAKAFYEGALFADAPRNHDL